MFKMASISGKDKSVFAKQKSLKLCERLILYDNLCSLSRRIDFKWLRKYVYIWIYMDKYVITYNIYRLSFEVDLRHITITPACQHTEI